MIIIFPEVEEFVQTLEKPTANKVVRLVELLERFEHRLSMPHCKAIGQNLFELRIRGKQEVRTIYTFQRGDILLFYAFMKKSQQIPQKVLNNIYSRFAGVRVDDL